MNPFAQMIPKKFAAWQAVKADAVYNRDTLYKYMDGGAEVYLAFSFREVFARVYSGPEGKEITLDIYDMETPDDAFGIFSCDRGDAAADIGQEAEYGFGLLRFWQGHYFVTITASADDAATGGAVLELGRLVVPHLGAAGPKPAMLQSLPQKGIRPERTSYFHSNISLNNRFFIASENILHLSGNTRCAFAEYDTPEKSTASLMLVSYADAAAARAAYESFLQAYAPEARVTGRARLESGKWVLATTKGSMVAVIFDAPDPEWAEGMLSSVKFPDK